MFQKNSSEPLWPPESETLWGPCQGAMPPAMTEWPEDGPGEATVLGWGVKFSWV